MAKKGSGKKAGPPSRKGQAMDATTRNLPAVQKSTATKKDLVNTELVDQAVHFINEKANETLYKGSEAIGTYLLENFFQNDINLASSRNPYKSASYTALCKRNDLVVHPATLSVMVRVAAQEKFFETEGIQTDGLSYTHKAELVKLPNGKDKTHFVKKALSEEYTSRQLAEEIKKLKGDSSGEESNTALLLAAVQRCIDNPVRLFDHSARSAFISESENLKKMKADTRRKIYEETVSMIEKTKAWTKRYEELKGRLEVIEGGKPTDEESSK